MNPEVFVGIAATMLTAGFLVMININAGPLWRDEVNSINVAQMPSLREFLNNLRFESFPPLWLLLLRLWSFSGLGASDENIRLLGLLIALACLGSLWLTVRWLGGRVPIISLGLLGALPAFLNILGANRAYGLAICLLALTFGAIWRVLQSATVARVLLACLASLLFVHCVYYDLLFLCAMLAGASLVAMRRRQWKSVAFLFTIGLLSGLSLLAYLPIIQVTSQYMKLMEVPFHNFSVVWEKLNEAVTLQSSAHWGPSRGLELWLWILLILLGTVVATASQRRALFSKVEPSSSLDIPNRKGRDDLALFCGVTMLSGIVAYICFLLKLRLSTQPWYYMALLTLCAISLDGILSAPWPALRPWGLARIGLVAVMFAWSARALSEELRTRRSSIDLVAAVIEKQANKGDLVVVESVWEAITFDRYYRGPAEWLTLPPITSHKVHRSDLVMHEMTRTNAIAPVLQRITETLRDGGRVWVLGGVPVLDRLAPAPPPAPHPQTGWSLSPYYRFWSAQLRMHLAKTGARARTIELNLSVPVNARENPPLTQFSAYKQAPEGR